MIRVLYIELPNFNMKDGLRFLLRPIFCESNEFANLSSSNCHQIGFIIIRFYIDAAVLQAYSILISHAATDINILIELTKEYN